MKRSEYLKRSREFRSYLQAEAAKPEGERRFPTRPEDWFSVEAILTCTTPTCVVRGQGFSREIKENADGVYRAVCGRCHTPITDINLQLEED
jgi:hypothetical protein